MESAAASVALQAFGGAAKSAVESAVASAALQAVRGAAEYAVDCEAEGAPAIADPVINPAVSGLFSLSVGSPGSGVQCF